MTTTPVQVRPIARPPVGWQWASLGEVSRLESGHTPSRRRPEYWGGEVGWLSLKDIRNLRSKYIYETVDMPTMLGIDNSSARLLPAGTVAFCRTASVGNAVILGREMATSQDFVNWICGSDLLPEYLYVALRSSSAEFDRLKQGSTHKTIYFPTVKRFQILLPPLDEQRRIAAILDKVDAIRRKRREAIQLTEELQRSTFLEMFGDPVTNPKGWPVVEMGNVAEIQGGLQVSHKRSVNPIEVPYLRVANVYRGRLDLAEIKAMRVTDRELGRIRLIRGDLLFVEGHGNPNEIGRAAIWDDSVADCVHQNHLIRVRLHPSILLPNFVSSLVNSDAGRRQIQRMGKTTSGLNTLSSRQIRSLRIMAPPIETQEAFARFVAKLDRVGSTLEQDRLQVDNLFNSLIQRAFRGELTRCR